MPVACHGQPAQKLVTYNTVTNLASIVLNNREDSMGNLPCSKFINSQFSSEYPIRNRLQSR